MIIRIHNAWYSDHEEYRFRETNNGAVIVRGDESRIHVDSFDDAECLAEKLAKGKIDDSEFNWE